MSPFSVMVLDIGCLLFLHVSMLVQLRYPTLRVSPHPKHEWICFSYVRNTELSGLLWFDHEVNGRQTLKHARHAAHMREWPLANRACKDESGKAGDAWCCLISLSGGYQNHPLWTITQGTCEAKNRLLLPVLNMNSSLPDELHDFCGHWTCEIFDTPRPSDSYINEG